MGEFVFFFLSTIIHASILLQNDYCPSVAVLRGYRVDSGAWQICQIILNISGGSAGISVFPVTLYNVRTALVFNNVQVYKVMMIEIMVRNNSAPAMVYVPAAFDALKLND